MENNPVPKVRVITAYGRKGIEVYYPETPDKVTVLPEHIDALVDELKKAKSEAATTVLHTDNDAVVVKYVIASDAQRVLLSKKIYASVEEAKNQAPPDGFRIFRAQVKSGAVLKLVPEYPLFDRKAGKWDTSAEYMEYIGKRTAGGQLPSGGRVPAKKIPAKAPVKPSGKAVVRTPR